jgi:hypothetical protein
MPSLVVSFEGVLRGNRCQKIGGILKISEWSVFKDQRGSVAGIDDLPNSTARSRTVIAVIGFTGLGFLESRSGNDGISTMLRLFQCAPKFAAVQT